MGTFFSIYGGDVKMSLQVKVSNAQNFPHLKTRDN